MENKRYIIGGIAMIGIIITSVIVGVANIPSSTLLTNYDPEEDAYWGMVSDDVLIFALYDELQFENGFDEKSYALLKHDILAIDDQGIDSDTYPDLLLNSQFLIGNEEIKISIGDCLDLNLLGFLVQFLSAFLELDLGESSLYIPTFPSFHFVNSEFLTILDLVSSSIINMGEFPSFSFDYDTLNATFDSQYWDNLAEAPNSIEVVDLFGDRDWSNGLKFNLTDNSSLCEMKSASFIPMDSNGNISYWVYADSQSFFEFYQIDNSLGSHNPYQQNGLHLAVNGSNICYYEGKETWFDNGLIQNWIPNVNEGNWTNVGNLTENTWNKITIIFENNYTQGFDVSVENLYGSDNFNCNYSVEDHAYDYRVNELDFKLNATEDSQVYLDDIGIFYDITNGNATNILTNTLMMFIYDFPLIDLLSYFTTYGLMYYPKIFNFDAFYDLIINLLRLIDNLIERLIGDIGFSFEDVFTSVFINEDDYFRIYLNNTMIEEIVSFIIQIPPLDILEDFEFVGYEGETEWYIQSTWDKQIGVMNETKIHFNYIDLEATREIGIKLIVTRSPNVVQDGYWYYTDTWFSNDYVQVFRPFAQHVSELNLDNYPANLPDEWNIFNTQDLTEGFLEEFDYEPILTQILTDNLGFLIVGLLVLIGSSIGLSYGTIAIIERIQKRKLSK